MSPVGVSPVAPATGETRSTVANKSARPTMPIGTPPRTTGSRLTLCFRMSAASSATGASGATAISGALITSRTDRRWFSAKSLDDRPSASASSHHRRRRSSARRPRRSPSLTMPIGTPEESSTGAAPIPFSSSSRATSRTLASAGTVITGVVIRSEASTRVLPAFPTPCLSRICDVSMAADQPRASLRGHTAGP